MTSAKAIQAAEPTGPGARYRWQAGREMYQAGRPAEAEMAGAWHQLAAPAARGHTHVELQERRWDRPAAATSPDRARPGSRAGLTRPPKANPNWRQGG